MSIKIFKAGILDTVQDMGRHGYQHLGINPGGAMDKFSAKVANILVGNNTNKAVIEFHFPASVLNFGQPALIALTGAEFSATINGEKIPVNHPILVNKNSFLQFHSITQGARAYLAVKDGLDIPDWLGSRSTNLKAGAGGYKGQTLRKDDEILFRNTNNYAALLDQKEFMILPWAADVNTDNSGEVFVLPGHEWKRLTDESCENFFTTSYVITNQSDRMGYRLNNIPLAVNNQEEVISTAVSFGAIQLLPDGRLILLMADHQTTGGYPRLAHVISAHHSKLAQMKAGDKIKFSNTDLNTAEDMLIKQQQHLLQLQNACTFRLSSFLKDKN